MSNLFSLPDRLSPEFKPTILLTEISQKNNKNEPGAKA